MVGWNELCLLSNWGKREMVTKKNPHYIRAVSNFGISDFCQHKKVQSSANSESKKSYWSTGKLPCLPQLLKTQWGQENKCPVTSDWNPWSSWTKCTILWWLSGSRHTVNYKAIHSSSVPELQGCTTCYQLNLKATVGFVLIHTKLSRSSEWHCNLMHLTNATTRSLPAFLCSTQLDSVWYQTCPFHCNSIPPQWERGVWLLKPAKTKEVIVNLLICLWICVIDKVSEEKQRFLCCWSQVFRNVLTSHQTHKPTMVNFFAEIWHFKYAWGEE